MPRTKGPRLRRKRLHEDVRKQMEFYFSDANLQKDRFLKQQMDLQEEKYVPLSVFQNCKKIQNLTNDLKIIEFAVSSSKLLELSADKESVRRTSPFIERNEQEVDGCTIYVELLPLTADQDWLRQTFSAYGEVVYVSLPRYKTSGDIKGFAFIEFKSKKEAEHACAAFADAEVEKAGKFPKYNKQIVTLNKQITVSQSSEGKQRVRRRRNTSDSSGGGGDTLDENGQKRIKLSGDNSNGDQSNKHPGNDRSGRKRSKSSSVSDLEISDSAAAEGKPAPGDTNRNKRKRKRPSLDPEQTEETKMKKASMGVESEVKIQTVKTQDEGKKDSTGLDECIPLIASSDKKSVESVQSASECKIEEKTSKSGNDAKSEKRTSKSSHVKIEEKPLESAAMSTNGQKTSESATNVKTDEKTSEIDVKGDEKTVKPASDVKIEVKVDESDDSLKGVIVDKSKRKRHSETDLSEEGEKEVKLKRVRIKEEVDFKESTEEITKKRRKRNRKQSKDQKEKIPEGKPKLNVIPKQEWSRLRKEYLSLQKESMATLKQSLRKVSYQSQQRAEDVSVSVEEHQEEKFNKEPDKPHFEFKSGVILKVSSIEPLTRNQLKENLSHAGDIAYIDLPDGTNEGHIRCKTPEDCQKMIATNPSSFSLNLLEGESETKYWEKMSQDRLKTMSTKRRQKKSGAKKLIEKAERMMGQGVPKKHIIFNADDEQEAV